LTMIVASGPRRRLLAFLRILALTMMMATPSACGSANEGQGEGQEEGSRPNNQQESLQEKATGGGQRNPERALPDDRSNGMREGAAGGKVYRAGEAGEVELRVENGRPVLVEARPNAGWNANVTHEGNEIEVNFSRGEAEWEFEAEPEHGGIKVKSEPR
jgi:hypothetical protein